MSIENNDDFERVLRPGAPSSVEHVTVGEKYYYPDQDARVRLSEYDDAEKLADVEQHESLFEVDDPVKQEVYVPVDLPGMLSRLMRHYVVSPGFKVEAIEKESQEEIDRIIAQNDFVTVLREVAESLPVYGEGVFRVDLTEPEELGAKGEGEQQQHALIRYVKPHFVHPRLCPLDCRKVLGVDMAWTFTAKSVGLDPGGNRDRERVVLREIFEKDEESGSVIAHFEAHYWDGEKLGDEIGVETIFPELDPGPTDLNIDEYPIVFVTSGRAAGEFWGRSDFPRIQRIVEALENRLAQLDEVLEKHARPKLVVPPGVLDDAEDGEGAKSQLARHFDVIEVEASIMDKVIMPQYLTWDMQTEGIKHEIEKLEEYFFMVTETSPASFGLERDGSQVESARALRFKAHRTVNRVEDQRDPMGDAIKAVLRIAQKLETGDGKLKYEVSKVKLTWGDPIIEDTEQKTQEYVSLRGQSLVSIERGLQDIFGLSPEEATAERAKILVDEADLGAMVTPAAGTLGLPGDELLGAEAGSAPPPAVPGPEVPAVPGAGSSALAAKPDETADKEVVLNGAQVTALVSIVQSVARNELPRDSGLRIIVTAFGLSEKQADEILGEAGQGFEPGGGKPDPETPPQPGEPIEPQKPDEEV